MLQHVMSITLIATVASASPAPSQIRANSSISGKAAAPPPRLMVANPALATTTDSAASVVIGDGMRDKEIDGKKVDLKLRYITNQRELRKNIQAVVEQQWKLVGIGVELVNYSSDVFWNGYNDDGPQAQGLYEIAEYSSVQNAFPDPDASSGWVCEQIASADNPDGANWQGYCNPKIDDLMKQQATTLDPTARRELYNQIEQILYDDYVYIGMWKDPDLWSINNRVKNVKLSGVFPFWNVQDWEVADAAAQ